MNMKNIATFSIAYMTLFECFQTLPTGTCEGRNGSQCCVGFNWDLTQEKCIPCGKGYRGNSCADKCPFPSYGVDCQMICNCIEEDCDPANGCNNPSTEYPITSLIGLENKIVTTKPLNYKAGISERTCVGINGTSCCFGFKWDLTQEKCIPCGKGYTGLNCDIKCPFPLYGVDCQMRCNCIEKVCDPVNGCNITSTEYPMTSLMGLENKFVTTELMSYEASISETCKEGYHGINCERKCRFPSYGLSCQKKCNCIFKDCDHVKGCLLSSKDLSKVTPNNNTTTCIAVKKESKHTNYLKFALIGLAIVSFIIACIYFHMRLLEKRFMITQIV